MKKIFNLKRIMHLFVEMKQYIEGGVYIELRYGLNCTQKQLKCLNNFNGNEAHLVFICKWL